MPKPHDENLSHVENVRIIEETTSGAGATGFDGRYFLPLLGITLLGMMCGIAYLASG